MTSVYTFAMTENASSTENLILVLVAGTNEPSNSNFMADHFIAGMKQVPGVTVEKLRIKDMDLSHFTLERYEEECEMEPDYKRLKQLLLAAKGTVIASPIWNFSVPAHLKNLIDRIGAFALDHETHSKGQFKGRPFVLLYTGGAPMIAWKALMYLTTLHVTEAIKYYGGTVVYRHFEPKAVQGRGKFGLVVDKRPESLAVMERKGKLYAELVDYYAKNGRLPASKQFVYAFFTFLYRVGNRIMYPISTLNK